MMPGGPCVPDQISSQSGMNTSTSWVTGCLLCAGVCCLQVCSALREAYIDSVGVDFVEQVLVAGGSEAAEQEDAKAAVAALSDA